MAEQANASTETGRTSTKGNSSEGTSTGPDGNSKVTTEGSARVLNEVKGRLENIDAGDLPVIEKIGPDGTSRRVDPTGEMIRPDAARLQAANEAAEAFAAEHSSTVTSHASAPAPAAPAQSVSPRSDPSASDRATTASDRASSTTERKGFWARIKSWFGRN